jgi:hypothetical protein
MTAAKATGLLRMKNKSLWSSYHFLFSLTNIVAPPFIMCYQHRFDDARVYPGIFMGQLPFS